MAVFRADAEPPGGTEHAIAEIQREERDSLYASEHYLELFKQFGRRWIAVQHERIVGDADRLTTLIEELEAKGIEPTGVHIDLLTDDARPRVV